MEKETDIHYFLEEYILYESSSLHGECMDGNVC